MTRAFLLTTFLGLAATVAPAAEPNAAMQAFLKDNILGWAQDPVLIDAIAAQNGRTAGFDAAQIETLDQQWRAEVGTGASEMVDAVLMNAAADFLRGQMEASAGMVTEIFIMDALGLNVAASGPTSDYWQGDEAKFQETFGVGAGAVHYSEIEFDESSQSYSVQISITLSDPATGAPVGAMTVGVDAESLM
jgi:hypothetical protein